jgi:DnaJ-class molecular chaperone
MAEGVKSAMSVTIWNPKPPYCPECNGTGFWHDAPPEVPVTRFGMPPCPVCQGTGEAKTIVLQ